MRRLMELVLHHRVDLTPLITHRLSLDEITRGYQIFGQRQDGMLKIAVKP